MKLLLLFLALAELNGDCEALIERLYCGKKNCYDCKSKLLYGP